MRHPVLHAAALGLFCAVLAAAPRLAAAADRVALLIGNADYDIAQLALKNPVNDIDALAPVLEDLGFATARFPDAGREDMARALDWLRQEGAGADIVFVFYAGHAVQVGSENYLIGTGLDTLTPQAVARQSLTLREIRQALDDTVADLSMVVIDACRDNPLAARGMVPSGLLPISGGAGTLIAYSTDPGNVAADGAGENSIFTLALLRNIDTPGLDVRLMFGRVRQEVVIITKGTQIPWVEEAVLGEHYLRGGPQRERLDDEIGDWRQADSADTVAAFEDYLAAYPDGLFARTAESRIALLQGGAPDMSPAALRPEDLPQAAAALEVLGYLSAMRGAGEPTRPAVDQAFEEWRTDQPAGFDTPGALLRDGAQMALMLGTYTAGILRKDLQNFVAMDQNLALAEADLARGEREFGTAPSAAAVLDGMRSDVTAIRGLRDEMADRLDASRSYYDDLIALAEGTLDARMRTQPLPRFGGMRGLGQDLPIRALDDARTFLGHLDLMATQPEGSYAWLADLLKETAE